MKQNNLDKWISELIRNGNINKGSKVLEVGCGTGQYTIPLWEYTRANITGFDLSPDMLEVAQSKAPIGKINWEHGNAENLKYDDNTFDCVTMFYVLHHFENQEKAIREIHRVLKPKGRLVIATASHGAFKNEALYKFFPEMMQIDLNRFTSIPELKKVLLSNGFDNVRYRSIKGDPELLSKEEYLEWILNKPISTFQLLTEKNFNKGVNGFKSANMDDPIVQFFVYYKCTVVIGEKK